MRISIASKKNNRNTNIDGILNLETNIDIRSGAKQSQSKDCRLPILGINQLDSMNAPQ